MSTDPVVDFSFAHDYSVDVAIGLPHGKQPLRFNPDEALVGCRFDLAVTFHPTGAESWWGRFASRSAYTYCGVFATPDPVRACVVSNGTAYLVNVLDARDYARIPIDPVRDVRAAPGVSLLLLADHTDIAAIGPRGDIWRSPRLCWDDLAMHEITDGLLHATGFDPMNSMEPTAEILIDLKTRAVLKSAHRDF